MRSAAYRHFEAGENLKRTNRKDVAGYIYGIAAECALKQMMLASGMRPLPATKRREDPFFAHFSELKTLLRDRATGRLAVQLLRYSSNQNFMQFWDVGMRYSDGKIINQDWIDRWCADAKSVIGAMDT